MRSSLLVTLRTLARTPSALIWTLAFPIVMALIFLLMFSGMRSDGTVEPARVAVVADDAWEASAFSEVAHALDEPDENRLVAVRAVADEAEGEKLLAAGEVAGVWSIGADGTPALTVADAADADAAILELVTSSYAQRAALVGELAARDPAALADADAAARALGLTAGVERVRLTHGVPDESVRYFYALLGMAALMAAQAGLLAVSSAQPGVSALGARRAVSGTSRGAQLAGCVLGAWVFSCACLAVDFLFLRVVAGVDFAGREGMCLVGVAAAALLATALGALVGAVPGRADVGARGGVLTAVTCVLALFAGLYGQAAMELSDALARALPWTAWVNPERLVCDLFYALYYYDALAPFVARLAACAAASAVLLAAATLFFRRQSHEHL